jgi:regulator of sirC expression with transglutaminase-like and TPR domain
MLQRVQACASLVSVNVEQNTTKPAPSATFTDPQLTAMLTLLADDDDAVRTKIRERLLAGGEPVFKFLETHRLHRVPAIRCRVLELLEQRDADRHDGAFMGFILSQGEQFDLEDGVWRFTLTRYPGINVDAFRAQLDEWADRVRAELPEGATGEAALLGINRLLFDELGFIGNQTDYYDPANSYLNRVMDRRRGVPTSLSVVYLCVARRLELPVVGVGMPGHFLCRYQTPREEFYIDPFHGGKLLSRIDCKRRIANLAVDYDDSHLAPVSSRRMLQRMIANLHLIHKERKQREEAERLQRYLIALSR